MGKEERKQKIEELSKKMKEVNLKIKYLPKILLNHTMKNIKIAVIW